MVREIMSLRDLIDTCYKCLAMRGKISAKTGFNLYNGRYIGNIGVSISLHAINGNIITVLIEGNYIILDIYCEIQSMTYLQLIIESKIQGKRRTGRKRTNL